MYWLDKGTRGGTTGEAGAVSELSDTVQSAGFDIW